MGHWFLSTVTSSFYFSRAPQAKTHSQALLESKAKWAITLRCDTSEASERKKRSLVCAAEGGAHSSDATMYGRALLNEEYRVQGQCWIPHVSNLLLQLGAEVFCMT